ncbi:MAG: glycosyltransferase family 2 protein [Flavobacteriaceae bacterium]
MTLNHKINAKVAIIIPAFNESGTIEEVVSSALELGDVVVVNDCSEDTTKKLVQQTKATLIDNDVNMGYEKSIVSGLNYVLDKPYVFAITIDADGQHIIEDVKKAINFLEKGADVVVGSRLKLPRTAEKIVSLLGKLFYGINDPFCGLKGYRLDLLRSRNLFSFPSIASELLVRIVKGGGNWNQFEIKTNPREFGKSTFDNRSFFTSIHFVKSFLRVIFCAKKIN